MKKNSDGRKLFPNVRNAESIPVILTIALAIVLGGILAAFCAVRSNVKSSQTEIAGASAVETAEETETVELASVSEEEYVATVRVTINPEFLLYINVNNEVVKCEAVNADEAVCQSCHAAIKSPKVIEYAMNKFGKPICYECQKRMAR